MGRQLVNLGCNNLEWNAELFEPLFHDPVQFSRLMASIHDHNRQLQVLILSQKFLDHHSPTGPNVGWNLGKSITRQVRKNPSVIDIEKVDDLGAPWCGTGPGQTLFTHQIIN